MLPFAQAQAETSFWYEPNGSAMLWVKVLLGLVLGMVAFFAILKLPTQTRRPLIAFVTFISGGFFILTYLWPKPINLGKTQLPNGSVEVVGKYLNDLTGIVVNFTQILSGFMLGLGIFSLLKVHLARIAKGHKDRFFSGVLLVSMIVMTVAGYIDSADQLREGAKLDLQANWSIWNYTRDFLFAGLLQEMDAVMFSIIAFFILSAAYRAFRVRSIESTILLSTALIVILSLMGFVSKAYDTWLGNATNDNLLLANLKISELSKFLRGTFQTSSINAITFGTGLGALAMGLRIWLSLEKQGSN